MAGGAANVSRTLAAPVGELSVRAKVNVASVSGASAVNFLKVRTATGVALAEVFVTPGRVLGLRNAVSGVASNTSVVVSTGVWHEVVLHVVVNGGSSVWDLSWDGSVVLSGTGSLGTAGVGRVQIGENVAGRTGDFYYDSITVTGAEPPAPPTPPVLFADGFESGSLSGWTSSSGVVVQSSVVADGGFAARALMAGGAANVSRTLAAPVGELSVRAKVNVASVSGASAVNFLKVRTATGVALAEVFVTPGRVLGLRNAVSGVASNTSVVVSTGVWHEVVLHVVVNGGSSVWDLSWDGSVVLSGTGSLGTAGVGRVQIGENVAGRTGDFYYDSITVTGALDPVLAAAGDIACDPQNPNFNAGAGTTSNCKQKAVSDAILADPSVTTVAALGDVQYECGGLAAFNASYDPSWGRFKSITKPAVGNHEYLPASTTPPGTACDPTGTAAGYFSYFGAAAGDPTKGYYSYDLGTWHVIVLNTTCSQAGGCGANSPQETWLRADLAAHPVACTLAYFHIPLWSSGGRAAENARVFTRDLYAAGAEVVLTGHDHTYERFAPQDGESVATPLGVRGFVVGTGGANHTTIASVAPNSEVRDSTSYGFLKLTLRPGSYAWQFVPVGGSFTDSGSQACH